jgi:alkanesulfonate monooxygenase SsuD/methylene tetrahydromethanopterin reductase-like flavin-dependent oxidoreductase (luciferase family)
MVAGMLAGYNDLPSYRGVMDFDDAGGPADVSIIGNEDEVRAGIAALADAGATDFAALEFALDPDDAAATRALLTTLAREG